MKGTIMYDPTLRPATRPAASYEAAHSPNVAWASPDEARLTCPCGGVETMTVDRDEFQFFQIAASALRRRHRAHILALA